MSAKPNSNGCHPNYSTVQLKSHAAAVLVRQFNWKWKISVTIRANIIFSPMDFTDVCARLLLYSARSFSFALRPCITSLNFYCRSIHHARCFMLFVFRQVIKNGMGAIAKRKKLSIETANVVRWWKNNFWSCIGHRVPKLNSSHLWIL